ncbi:hypothetical protein J8L85_02660 [Maribacter sp. MMG018]|uniref:hypothetical protein n=1 Tax=Maribacter sp. MMG018 TaxID=2822688 RepID=UPI001B3777F8|nr:hypothetical protein [Maribacter sp. MMG018]MBQ4913324.1 hypothetical protein [Maribacter sp. MMG018]
MNGLKPFYNHESDDRIMVKKDTLEVRNWTDHLEYINEELDYLLDIEDSMLNNSEIYAQLHAIRRENTIRLATLYRYQGTIKNAVECDTLQCDSYYLSTHEKNRSLYIEHIQKYRNIKSKILSKILLHAKR